MSATDTVMTVSDATIAADGKKVSSSYRQDAGIQTQGQQVWIDALSLTANAGDDNRHQPAAVRGRLDSGVLPE